MPEKKKILFISYSLHSGGIEKSLVTVLSLFNYDAYDVDLQLFANEGLFLDQVPPQVHLLQPLFPPEYRLNIRQAFFALIRRGHPLMALGRLLVSLAGMKGTMGERLAKMWRIERRFARGNKKKYDAAVAYMEGQPIYYNVTKVKSRVKIGFIHGDYKAMGLNDTFDREFIGRLDALCTVSESCLSSLKEVFPEYAEKCHVIYNIISPEFIRSLAAKGKGFTDPFSGLRILSIARLSRQKGLDIALPAVAELHRRGILFRWYIIGVGPEEAKLKDMARDLGIEDVVFFMGECPNPYAYLNECDLYLQPSRFEGKSIAVDEAMVMCRPILLTNFSTASDQIDSGRNGLIVPMTPEGIRDGLADLLLHEDRRKAFSKALAEESISNESELQKLYRLIDGKPIPDEDQPAD
ncbi:MAG: glycosyltransferase [Oscillospiraceae bacterium]|jgi:glycosyltransferase involved in cell wall biosynthesis|nr:glycosyltransferase [Oscillospiraceae bacterium]